MSSLIGCLISGNLSLSLLIISAVSSTDKVVWVIYATGFVNFFLFKVSTSDEVSINCIDPLAIAPLFLLLQDDYYDQLKLYHNLFYKVVQTSMNFGTKGQVASI